MIESALSFLAFTLITLGLFEFSMAIYAYNFCSYSARDAARWASVRGSTSDTPATAEAVRAFVRNASPGLVTSDIQVSTAFSPTNSPGSTVQITVAYTIVPLVGLTLKNNLAVSSTSKMTIVR